VRKSWASGRRERLESADEDHCRRTLTPRVESEYEARLVRAIQQKKILMEFVLNLLAPEFYI
jgi:hypothetical protein